MPPLRLVTYNIRKGKGASGRADKTHALGEALAAHAPDLLLCQEVFHAAQGAQQSELLARALGLGHYYGRNKDRQVGHHGNTTFTRAAVEHAENFDISMNRLEKRGVLYVRIRWDDAPLHIFNAHLSLTAAQRRQQIEMIGGLLQRCKDEAVLLAGDFNDWNGRLDKMITEKLGLRALLPPGLRTWHAQRPVFSLDRIYVRKLSAVSTTALDGSPWRELSDHLPLAAELEREKN